MECKKGGGKRPVVCFACASVFDTLGLPWLTRNFRSVPFRGACCAVRHTAQKHGACNSAGQSAPFLLYSVAGTSALRVPRVSALQLAFRAFHQACAQSAIP